METRAALYLRVSTGRQAENDLSIPDQRRQLESYCQRKGWTVAREFVESGASATDDRRPAFQEMIAAAKSPERTFDVVVVHSFSRFFRDAFLMELHLRDLRKNGVSLVSITQETGEDPMSDMIRKFLSMFDEYSSKENAKHTLRAMKENARQGFWNGSRPPYGYRTVEAERRGDKIKKRLEVDTAEAEIVRMIFALYDRGAGRGPLGIKGIADHLNRTGYRYRNGRKFSTGLVHRLLTRPTYIGKHHFNRVEAKTWKQKPEDEWIEVTVPSIIDPETFARVQSNLAERNPKKTPPRVVNGPTLLTSLARCATCGGGMTLRTGKGGKYRYYTCSTCARQGKTACKGRSIPMDLLDRTVIDHFTAKILAPERLETMLRGLEADQAGNANARLEESASLKRQLREVEERSNRLLDLVERGVANLDDDTLRNRLSVLGQQRDEVQRLIALKDRERAIPRAVPNARRIRAFAMALEKKLRDPDRKFAKAYLRLFIDRIEVDDQEIRIQGPKSALVAAVNDEDSGTGGGVPSFVPEWRPQGDSNPCYRRERAVS